jgi:predicted ATPase
VPCGRALWCLGAPDDALQREHETLIFARELSHPPSLAFALVYTAMLHQFRREGRTVQEHVEAVLTLSTEHGFPFWFAMATILQGWVLAAQGEAEAGIAQMRQGLSAYQAVGSALVRPYFLALQAESYGKSGQIAEGLAVLVEALAIVESTGERWWEADLHRLKGELLLAQAGEGNPSVEAAEACFQQALTVARRQQARSLELRTAMSLARLWQGQGQHAEARQLLTSVYDWFTEGFETADLREAKGLLEALT